jgi:hypothetical protein
MSSSSFDGIEWLIYQHHNWSLITGWARVIVAEKSGSGFGQLYDLGGESGLTLY